MKNIDLRLLNNYVTRIPFCLHVILSSGPLASSAPVPRWVLSVKLQKQKARLSLCESQPMQNLTDAEAKLKIDDEPKQQIDGDQLRLCRLSAHS